jgi:hypothetical protein
MRGRSVVAAVLLMVVAGLAVAGGAVADWVVEEITVEVAGLQLPDYVTTTGLELVPALLPLGLVAAVGGAVVAALRGRARRVAAGVVAALGVVALAVVPFGLVAAADIPGGLTPAPALSAVGAVGVVAGAALALRRRQEQPALSARYDLDGRAGEDAEEWSLASEEPPEPTEGQGDGRTEGEGTAP